MNQQHPGTPPYGQGGWPPPGQQPPPTRPGSGRTLAWLAAGLVVVLLVIGAVALVMLSDGDDDDAGKDDQAGGDARKASCEVYRDVVLSPEIWAATDLEADKLQEMYDAVRADLTDDEIDELVAAESDVVVGHYRAVDEWKQSMEDALSRGENPDTSLPAEITGGQAAITQARTAVLEACAGALPQGDGGPQPQLTAPPLDRPDGLDEE